MKVFTAYVNDKKPNPAENAVLVPEAFSWAGFIFPFNIWWAISNKSWMFLAIIAMVEVGIYILGSDFGIDKEQLVMLRFPMILAMGVFANDILRFDLSLKGYKLDSVVYAKDKDEAFYKFANKKQAALINV